MRRRDALITLALLAAVLFIYARTARFDYVLYDDHAYVFENPHVSHGLSAASVWWAFSGVHLANWHPLTTLSYLLDVSVFGLRPGPMHFENALLHAMNTVLLFALLRTLSGGATWRSALVATLFGLHPLHVESVAWISERKDVLSTLLLFLAIFAYVRHVRADDTATRRRWYAAMIVLFVLAFTAKSMVVTFPAMLLLLDYAALDRIHSTRELWRRTVEKWPLIVLAVTGCGITIAAQRAGGALRTVEEFPLGHRVANGLVSYVVYLAKMIWPARLAIPYPPRESIVAWHVAAAAALLIALTLLALAAARRGRRYVAAGWFWFLGTLLPVIGIVQVGNQSMADRYTYVPLIGLFVIVAWGAAELSRKVGAVAVGAAAVAVLIGLAAATEVQVGYWHETRTLFAHSVEVEPTNWLAWHQLALYDVAHNDLDDADRMYERTLSLKPQSALVHTNYANNLMRQDRLADAEAHYRRALKSRPDYALALNNYGNLLIRQQRIPEAFDQFSRAVAVDPSYAPAHANLGWMLLGFGQIGRAEAEFRESVRLDPDLREGRRGLDKIVEIRRAQPSAR